MRARCLVAFGSVAMFSCVAARDPDAPAYSPDQGRVAAAASLDLDCAQRDIIVSELGDGRFLAEGCGAMQTYEVSCTSTPLHRSEHCSARPAAAPESGDEDEDEGPAEAIETDDE